MSAIKEMSILSARVPGAVSLAWGLPSFPTPAPIREAVARALQDDPKIGMYLPRTMMEVSVLENKAAKGDLNSGYFNLSVALMDNVVNGPAYQFNAAKKHQKLASKCVQYYCCPNAIDIYECEPTKQLVGQPDPDASGKNR